MNPFQVHNWLRDARNPVFPPLESFDCGACMNPFVLRREDEYWMFYAGGDAAGARRICLAIAPVNDLTIWNRLGPIFDVGAPGSFDDLWCVLPCVHRIDGRWHLYYTGRGNDGEGLQSFRGIGLAVSDDLLHWTKYSHEPVLKGDGFAQYEDNAGIAGGGRIIEVSDVGSTLLRMYYTLAVGTPSDDLLIDQRKLSVIAHSRNGLEWFDKRIVLEPRSDADYENAATIALNVWPIENGFRAVYAAIGSRFGAYSICEAQSLGGLSWERGKPDENLALAPQGVGWESEMVEYPNVIEENGRLRLFYCGNGYGATGIGTAPAEYI